MFRKILRDRSETLKNKIWDQLNIFLLFVVRTVPTNGSALGGLWLQIQLPDTDGLTH